NDFSAARPMTGDTPDGDSSRRPGPFYMNPGARSATSTATPSKVTP
ncbi:unnamed protein product, partial [Mycena citricolor]